MAVLTLDEPPANTYSYELMRELDAAILEARMDDAVHVIVLTGAGEKFFCAGRDDRDAARGDAGLQVLLLPPRERNDEPPRADAEAGHRRAERAHRRRRLRDRDGGRPPRSPAKDAGKIGLPEVALGVLPGTGGTQRLARLVGKARAIELMVNGRLMTMDEAAAMGLVTEVWDDARLAGRSFREAIIEYAVTFTPPHKASRAVGRIKRAVQSGLEAGFGEGLALERELQQLLFESDDAKEGIAASLEKRAPKFTGT